MSRLLVFGGTTEGRELAAFLKEHRIAALVLVATEYGQELADAEGTVSVRAQRLNAGEIADLIRTECANMVIDATHPYAGLVSENIKAACKETGAAYHRVLRESEWASDCRQFDDMDSLISWLERAKGNIFATTGMKSAARYAQLSDYKSRVWLRVLPAVESLETCLRAGFPPSHIICMQGPFSAELNAAMFRAVDAKILITKESGRPGGFSEKLEAARACGMEIAILKRPSDERGISLSAVFELILNEEHTL